MSQTSWARAFMSALRDAGVADLVVSPGSRSTPFVAAAIHAGLACHCIIDERAAGFFALGRAKLLGTPVALLCTSGSAGCHYFPAIVEASHAFVPLIAITADRPAELHGCAAPQAMDQTRLYGQHVRASLDLGTAHNSDVGLRAVQRKAFQAVTVALTPTPGPVHINAPARKPLEPDANATIAPRYRPFVHAPTRTVSDDAIAAVVDACKRERRGVIVAGPAPVSQRGLRMQVSALSVATGYPVLAEATSQLRLLDRNAEATTCDGFAPLLSSSSFANDHRPDVIIQIGQPTAGWELSRYVAASRDAERYVLTEHGWADPNSDADAVLNGSIADALVRIAAGVTQLAGASAWTHAFTDGSELAWRCVETALAEHASETSEDQIMRAVVSNLPANCLLMLGNSLCVRTIDWFCPRTVDVDVGHQRGLNGIDGLIAGAAGAASARTGPTVLIVGDVSFAHDVGGLAAARHVDTPLVIVVVDNRGGHIFDYLPIATHADLSDQYQRHWVAEQDIDVCGVATSYGYKTAAVSSAAEMVTALDAAVGHAGCTIIHAPVAAKSAQQRKQIIADAIDREYRNTAGAVS